MWVEANNILSIVFDNPNDKEKVIRMETKNCNIDIAKQVWMSESDENTLA